MQLRESANLKGLAIRAESYVVAVGTEARCSDRLSVNEDSFQP